MLVIIVQLWDERTMKMKLFRKLLIFVKGLHTHLAYCLFSKRNSNIFKFTNRLSIYSTI